MICDPRTQPRDWRNLVLTVLGGLCAAGAVLLWRWLLR